MARLISCSVCMRVHSKDHICDAKKKRRLEKNKGRVDSDLFYNTMNKNNMNYISMKMHIDRSHCYRMREKIVYKIMPMLYPSIVTENMPLLNAKCKW